MVKNYIVYVCSTHKYLIKFECKSLFSNYELKNATVIDSSDKDMIGFHLNLMDIHDGKTILEFKDRESAQLVFEVY